MLDILQLLKLAEHAAFEAGKAIMEVYQSGEFDATLKADRSPLTLADNRSHAIIMSALESSGLPVLSEEGSSIDFNDRKQWKYFWLADPLDGTKEFIKKNGEFTVNIALMQAQQPVAGVIYVPAKDVLYSGSQETGVVKGSMHIPPLASRNTLEALLQKEQVSIVASRSHNSEETNEFISQF